MAKKSFRISGLGPMYQDISSRLIARNRNQHWWTKAEKYLVKRISRSEGWAIRNKMQTLPRTGLVRTTCYNVQHMML